MRQKILLVSFFLVGCLYAAWSWISCAPGLVLSTNKLYWQAQNFLWDNFYSDRMLVTSIYVILITLLLGLWLAMARTIKFASAKQFWTTVIILAVPFVCSYNALSYDVFNYLFNAKMVLVYHANPHVQVALDFAGDDWVRFMHNVHTAAPYGYGFTLLSLLPVWATGVKFSLSWLAHKLINVGLWAGMLAVYRRLAARRQSKVADYGWWLALNPLVLMEILGNGHNDLWMMLPALLSFVLAWLPSAKNRFVSVTASVLLYILSLSIKFATLALLPVMIVAWGAAWWPQWCERLKKYVGDGSAVMMVLPLMTARSQLFHPWYLVWALTFAPLCRSRYVRALLIILTASSLYRYGPYLWLNGYDSATLGWQQLISWGPAVVYTIIIVGRMIYQKYVAGSQAKN